MKVEDLSRVVFNTVNLTNFSGKWFEPFNQVSFFNYDTAKPVMINQFVLPPAQTVGGFVYPTVLEYNLNTGEVNVTYFTIDCGGSATANCQCIYSQYQGIPLGTIQ